MTKLIFAIAAAALTASAAIPAVYAQQNRTQPNPTGRTPAQTGRFCQRINQENGPGDKISDRYLKWQERADKREEGLAEKRAEQDAKKAQQRAEHDAKLDEHFSKLPSEEGSETLKIAVKNAISAHRTAIDAAQNTFRTDSDKIILAHRQALTKILEEGKASSEAALAKVKSDCAGTNPDEKKIQQTYRNSLLTARKKMQTDRKALESLNSQLEQARTARKYAIETAHKTLKDALKKAREDYRSSRNDSGQTTTLQR